jgi:hypothetical protein
VDCSIIVSGKFKFSLDQTDFLEIHLTVKSRTVHAVSSARKVAESRYGTQTAGTDGSKSLVTESWAHHPHLKERRVITALRDVTPYNLAAQRIVRNC